MKRGEELMSFPLVEERNLFFQETESSFFFFPIYLGKPEPQVRPGGQLVQRPAIGMLVWGS